MTTGSSAGLDPLAIKDGFAHFPQGVVLIAAELDGEAQGLVASSFTVGVSLEPPLVSVAIQHTSTTWPKLREAPQLGISLLGSAHHESSRQLAGQDRARRFEGLAHTVSESGALHLDGVPAWLSTRVYDELPAGDHVIVLLEVLDIGTSEDSSAMVMHQRVFHELTAPDYMI